MTSSQHLEALISSNGAWTATDITQATGTPLAAPATPLLMRSQGAWDYIDINGDVHEIYFLSSGWSLPDITAQTGAPKAESGSALSGFLDSSGNVHMLYVTTNQHLEALISSNGAWTATDITQATGAPLAAPATPLLMRSQGAWDYMDTNGDVHEIYFLSSGWSSPDITAQTGAPKAESGSALSSFLDSSGNVHMLYVTSSQHLEALISSNGAWTATDITQATGTPLAAPGTPLLMRSQGAWDYIDTNGDVHEIYFLSSGWSLPDITAQTGAPKAEGGALSGFLDSSGNVHMLYVTTSQHLEALISSNGAWTATDITQATGSPVAAARTPLLMRSQGAWDYSDINGDVHEIYFLSSGWSLPDITAQTGAPKAE